MITKEFDIMKFAYVRVSSEYQNEARQIAKLQNYVIAEKIFVDKKSGKDFDRPNYQNLKQNILRNGDELYVTSIDRLGRNKEMIKDELQDLKIKGIAVKILDLPTTICELPENNKWVTEMINSILIEVYTSLAEHERINIRQRQAEGIANYKSTGKTKTGRPYGRPPIKKPKNWEKIFLQWKHREISADEAIKLSGLPRSSFYRLAQREHE